MDLDVILQVAVDFVDELFLEDAVVQGVRFEQLGVAGGVLGQDLGGVHVFSRQFVFEDRGG